MKIIWKLALSYAWRNPARMLLSSLAMIAAACVVVWVVSGYDAIVSQFADNSTEYMGRYDMFLVPDSLKDSYIPADLIEKIRSDKAIAELEPVLQATVTVQKANAGGTMMSGPSDRGGIGTALSGRGGTGGRGGQSGGAGGRGGQGSSTGVSRNMMFFSSPKLVGTNAGVPPYQLLEGRWIGHNDPALREAVISKSSAEQLQVKLDDTVTVVSGTNMYGLKIVGIVQQASKAPTIQKKSSTGRPMMSGFGNAMGPALSALYVPMALAGEITGQSGRVNLVNIKLNKANNASKFRARWISEAAAASSPVLLAGIQEISSALDEGMTAAGAKGQAWAATGMSLLAALFIIFTTLSMGVSERVRQFAVMRAVGLTRMQVAGVIAAEGLVLAVIGWGGGLAAGWAMLKIVSRAQPTLFTNGASLGTWCILLTGASAVGGALLASIMPAWQATRAQPLDAMTPSHAVRPGKRLLLTCGMIGIILIAVNPLLVFVVPIPDAMRYGIYTVVGCTCMALGFMLLAPLAIAATEYTLAPLTARLIGLEPRLLRFQLSSNLWRTLGTTVALSVGLGLYVSMMVWGYSMLEPFKPGAWVPDMLAAFQVGGLPDSEIEAVRSTPGVIAQKCIPLAVEQPRLARDITDSENGNNVTRQNTVIMIGLDPETAFGGSSPLIGAKFTEGSAAEAVTKLKQGRYCIVPDHFLTATGLKIGDGFSVVPPQQTDKTVEYKIAGAVSLPGWHWMTKFNGFRRRDARSAAMIFANYDDVRRDFNLQKINFFWMNIDKNIGVEKIGTALRTIADRNLGERQPVNAQGTWAASATMFGDSLRITTPDQSGAQILSRSDSMIWAMCELPLITLLVTSLGVINTIMASVRARRWELGVLRAVGTTRWGLSRMILAEGLLIGLVACLLSLAFGVTAGWCGTGISRYVSFFGGMDTPLVVPWLKLTTGFSITLGLCLVAALWPAISTGRTEPLKLLQAGRAAM
jgi:putative ABC transport system permease protein